MDVHSCWIIYDQLNYATTEGRNLQAVLLYSWDTQNFPCNIYCSDDMWASWLLKSPVMWLFVLQVIHTLIKEFITASYYWPLLEDNPPLTFGFPSQRASKAESISMLTHLAFELSWWRHQMETFSALLALCAGNSPITGEFPEQRPVTLSFDVFFDLRLNKRLSKQSRGWWFETPSHPLWRHFNG